MRTLVTGSAGFAGTWLTRELIEAGHDVRTDRPAGERIEITDQEAVDELLRATQPDLVIHLAAVAFGPDAAADAAHALRVNVGGTAGLVESLRRLERWPALLVVSSAEVYSPSARDAGPIDETAATVPTGIYGLSKLAQESVAVAAVPAGLRVAIVRPFNHTGPGQRTVFAVPAFASRIIAARSAGNATIKVGNMDVRRDIGDVRDSVRAYRLVGEHLVAGRIEPGSRFNVATGIPTRIGDIIDRLSALAGGPIEAQVDPDLVRPGEPVSIVGDAARLRSATGWTPGISLDRTLADVLADVEGRAD